MTRCAKIRYRDKLGAQIALMNVQGERGSQSAKVERRVYRCPKCKGWHLTSRR